MWSWKYNRRVLYVVVRGVGDILTVLSNDVPPRDTTAWHMRSNRLRIVLKHLNIPLWLGLNGFYIKTYKEILIAEVVNNFYICLLVIILLIRTSKQFKWWAIKRGFKYFWIHTKIYSINKICLNQKFCQSLFSKRTNTFSAPKCNHLKIKYG